VREVTLRIRHHGEPESDISAEYPGVTLRSRSSMTGRTAERKRIIEVSGDPEQIGPFLADFEAADAIVALEPLTPVESDRVFVAMTYDAYRWDSIAERLSNLGVHYRNGTTINAGWERWTLYLEDDDDLSAIVEHIEEAGNDADLVRDVDLSDVRANEQFDLTRLARELTPRQREVLTTAIRMGYYKPDRDTSIEEIGERLGISRTTTWEHLKRAEKKVMSEIYDFLDAQL
jgi:predicted DNA binding protein